MRRGMRAVSALLVLALAGCYHATIDTGLQPSGQKVEKKWAHSFLYGLVPPSTVETSSKCPNGVARVETQLSFLNQVASALTFGIYAPMQISVQCAAAGMAQVDGELRVAPGASAEEARSVLARAAIRSAESEEPVVVRFLAE